MDAAYFREKAVQSRWLARRISRDDDPTKAALNALADKLEARAKAQEAREAAEKT